MTNPAESGEEIVDAGELEDLSDEAARYYPEFDSTGVSEREACPWGMRPPVRRSFDESWRR